VWLLGFVLFSGSFTLVCQHQPAGWLRRLTIYFYQIGVLLSPVCALIRQKLLEQLCHTVTFDSIREVPLLSVYSTIDTKFSL